uniref:Placenta associated 8, tandem duplicate 1 n=1 Tax=Sinocyclocheilus rhinocerous TaxID=307959 RepID=A0A673MH79_9TELE
MEVTSQPAAFEPKDFHTGLMSCCEDTSVCCCGCFCLPCLGCSIASEMNECCLCGLGMPIRSVYRTKYKHSLKLACHVFKYICTDEVAMWYMKNIFTLNITLI